MNWNIFSVPAALALAGAISVAPVVGTAQAQTTPPQMQEQAPGQQNFSDEEVRSYVEAALEVDEISRKWQTRLQESGDPEKAGEYQAKAQDEMVQAVEEKGLTVEQYNSIYLESQANPELRSQIARYVEQVR